MLKKIRKFFKKKCNSRNSFDVGDKVRIEYNGISGVVTHITDEFSVVVFHDDGHFTFEKTSDLTNTSRRLRKG